MSLIRSYTSVFSTNFILLAAAVALLLGGGAEAFAAPAQAAPISELHRNADIFESTRLAPVLSLGIFLVVVGVLANWRGAELAANILENPQRLPKTPST